MNMIQTDAYQPDESIRPDLSHIVTEDNLPVDNRFSERQQRLLPHLLFTSWPEGRPFEALSNVGLFYAIDKSPVVPDFMLSLGVKPMELTRETETKSYFMWVYGKPPDLAVEIVSNRVGGESTTKMELYAYIRVTYYVVYDPFKYLSQRVLKVFRLEGGQYVEMLRHDWLPEIGLGLTLWEGTFDDSFDIWLRFVRQDGSLLLTGDEKAIAAEAKAESAKSEAEAAKSEAESAKSEAEAARQETARAVAQKLELERKLRELGIDPNG
jgi:Uma2 family endonuclease